ncbi:MAG TPA: PAS domain-containing sensor histidine kinase [Arcobacter sp.]|jgi:PAS domain S-box-containing protein|nr:PAS domain-containing sensor histidine kinase [Arcobacter sp.]
MTTLLLFIIFLLFIVIIVLYSNNKKTTQVLKEKEYNCDFFFNSSLEGIIVWDKHKTIVSANKTFLKLTGYNSDEIYGKNVFDFVDPKDYDNFQSKIFEHKSNEHELYFIRKDGTDFLAKVSKNIYPQNDTTSDIWFITDLSTIKQKEIELEKLNRELEKKINEAVQENREKDRSIIEKSRLAQLGEMISMIAHQWRQPLTAISATCNNIILQTMMDKKLQEEEVRKELELVTGYTKYLSDTIDDFRNFFKKNKFKEKTTIDKIINDTLYIISSTIENHNITLTTSLNASVEIETYTGEIKQVILSIIKNAQDALRLNNIKNAEIRIDTYTHTDYVELIISDNAKGIPINILDRIFEPYFSTKKELDGTGLGLYMSKIIVEKNCDGKLFATNKNDGAVFFLQLPINNN